jgi:hypothetical protein
LAGYMDLAGFDPDEEEEEFNSVGSRHHY